MITTADYAILSAVSYNAARDPKNQLDFTLTGWTPITNGQSTNPINGFGATAYQNGNDIVIAYQGTNFYSNYSDANGVMWDRLWSTASDFLFGNLPLAIGNFFGVGLDVAASLFGQQVMQAALFYQQVKAANPSANISFTGHSLGGGA